MMRQALVVPLLLLGVALGSGALLAEGEGQPGKPEEVERREATGTLTDSLQGQDGVRIQTLCTHCNSANIQVGGLSQELAPVCRDGFPLLGGLATSMVLSILPSDTIANTEVRKGPGAGGSPSTAAGGVILLTDSTPLEMPKLDFKALAGSYGRQAGTLRFAGPLRSWLSGSLVAGKDSADPVDDDEDGTNDVGAVEREFAEGRLTFDAGDHTVNVFGSWIGEDTLEGRGAFDFISSLQDGVDGWVREDALVDRREYRASWEWSLGQGRVLETRLLHADREQSQVSQDQVGDPLEERLGIDERGRWADVRYTHPLGLKWLLRAGLEAQEERVQADAFLHSALIQSGEDELELFSAFVEAGWNPSAKWELSLETRFDESRWSRTEADTSLDGLLPREREKSHWSPRLKARYTPRSGVSVELVAGETFRAPRSIFREVCCGQRYQRSILANAEIGRSLGIEGTFQPSPDLRASIYVARTEFDQHLFRLVGWSEFYTQTYTMGNIPDSRADTAEINARWSPARWTFDGSFSWLSHHNRGERTVVVPVIRFATLQDYQLPIDRVPYQPVRSGSFSATYTFPGGISLTGQANYTGSMLIQQFELLFTQTQNGALQELRETPGFWLVNLSFRAKLRKQLELVGGVDNLSDRIQNDLDDPTTDFNWGPLSGRAWRLGLRYFLDR